MAVRGQDGVAGAEVALDRLRLGGRLDDHKVAAHPRESSISTHPAVHALVMGRPAGPSRPWIRGIREHRGGLCKREQCRLIGPGRAHGALRALPPPMTKSRGCLRLCASDLANRRRRSLSSSSSMRCTRMSPSDGADSEPAAAGSSGSPSRHRRIGHRGQVRPQGAVVGVRRQLGSPIRTDGGRRSGFGLRDSGGSMPLAQSSARRTLPLRRTSRISTNRIWPSGIRNVEFGWSHEDRLLAVHRPHVAADQTASDGAGSTRRSRQDGCSLVMWTTTFRSIALSEPGHPPRTRGAPAGPGSAVEVDRDPDRVRVL